MYLQWCLRDVGKYTTTHQCGAFSLLTHQPKEITKHMPFYLINTYLHIVCMCVCVLRIYIRRKHIHKIYSIYTEIPTIIYLALL